MHPQFSRNPGYKPSLYGSAGKDEHGVFILGHFHSIRTRQKEPFRGDFRDLPSFAQKYVAVKGKISLRFQIVVSLFYYLEFALEKLELGSPVAGRK